MVTAVAELADRRQQLMTVLQTRGSNRPSTCEGNERQESQDRPTAGTGNSRRGVYHSAGEEAERAVDTRDHQKTARRTKDTTQELQSDTGRLLPLAWRCARHHEI